MTELCIVCKKNAQHFCGKCGVVRYCSREHQKSDWKTHKSTCFPCKVEINERLGRYLVSTKDIKAGDIIFSDPPILVGPLGIMRPVCLGCMNYVNGSYKCTKCGWPLCGPLCNESPNHIPECDLTQKHKGKVNITHFEAPNPMYHCVAPLRCLWLKKNDPKNWEILNKMEAHLVERKNNANYEKAQHYIVNIIRGYFGLTEFDEDLIQKICGILEVNGFDVPRANSVALYGFGYLMEHSCLANTTRTFGSSNLELVVRASVDIKKGDHIQTSYVDVLKGERIRKSHLEVCKYFICSCIRCQDSTDLGTHLSSIKCIECPKGLLPPPRNLIDSYQCHTCGAIRDACEVEKMLVKEYEQMNSVCDSISSKEKYLRESGKFLSENHHYRIKLKMELLQFYGKENEGGIKKISTSDLKRKIELAEQILEIANILVPGLSRLRGIILYELQSAYQEQYTRLPKKIKRGETGITLLQKIKHISIEAIRILQLETHVKEEMQMALEIENQMKEMEKKELGSLHKYSAQNPTIS